MPKRFTFRERQVHIGRVHDMSEHVAMGAIAEDQSIFVGTVALAEMFGYEPQELIRGMTINDLVSVKHHRGLVAAAIAETDENTRRAMRGVDGRKKDGTSIKVSVELEFNVTVDETNCTVFTVVRRDDE